MKILQHLSALAIITIIMGLIYVCVQQTYRSNANDPQTALIHEMKTHLQNGRPYQPLVQDSIDLASSESLFIASYDAKGSLLQSNALLNGQLPKLPEGVLDHAKEQGENWITWQPQNGVRLALGIAYINASPVSFIVAGRSLKTVEQRVRQLTKMVFIAWMLCIIIVLINWSIAARRKLINN